MNRIEFGDCRDTMRRWASEGVKAQMCVTSPPYFGLRDYGHEGQIGLEQTPDEYVARMVDVFREVRRVLEHLGLEVSRLLRTAYGPFELLDLPRGQAVEIRQVEVERFRRALVGGTGTDIKLTAPQQARARIARSAPRRSDDAPRKPAAPKPGPARTGPARSGPARPGPAKPGARKPAPRKPGPRK